ncbi:hypothetical protein FACS1894169_09730 [Bacteroidia bacterium]|nr:hypothetical protein FACS1894169_09730 [Bacteroidia bacterium]
MLGKELVNQMSKLSADARDLFIEECFNSGNRPDFMNKFARVDVRTTDKDGKIVEGYYFVAPDYLCIGTNNDFIRMPVQPATAQRIADKSGCFLSTRKISDDVYNSAVVKLEPHPLTKDRDSLYTFIEHNNIIEGQRAGRSGLIAGHKKDVIITQRLLESPKDDRVALYGWHKPDGKPIQPIYTGHVDWYLDYSHGIRLVKDTIYVEGKPMHYIDVMKHPVYSRLISDEEPCDYYAYPTENNSRKKTCYLDGFSLNGLNEQRLVIKDAFPDVTIIVNAPSPVKFDRDKKTALVLYALPNGNTIDWTAGKLMENGDDWHYDIQHIGAQMRFVRDVCPGYNWVVAYLQSYEKSSWTTWSKNHPDNGKMIIQQIVDSLRNLFAPYHPVIMLNGHSGGGRFIFDYITGVGKIPHDVERIAFLDSSYGYEDSLHYNKLKNWLKDSKDRYLDVIAYNDSTVIYNGKPLVSPTGGTWYRSRKMQKDLSADFDFKTVTDTTMIRHDALNRRIQFRLKQNDDGKNIYHTVLVERNGLIHSLLSGTKYEDKQYLFWDEWAYRRYIFKTGY